MVGPDQTATRQEEDRDQPHDRKLNLGQEESQRGQGEMEPAVSGRRRPYSHSMVPGGFDVMSNTTRLTPFTSLTIRLLIRASTS